MTRQNRNIARSASRRFCSSADGVGETVLLGAGVEATGVTEMPGWGSGSLQLARPATKAQRQDTLGEAAEPSLHHAPPHRSSIHLRDRSDRGGQRTSRYLHDVNRVARARNPGERLVDNRPHPDTTPRSGEAPDRNRCGWSGPLAYNVLCCTQKRREQRRLHRVSAQPRRTCGYALQPASGCTTNWSPIPVGSGAWRSPISGES
jgi:hypothetical protein